MKSSSQFISESVFKVNLNYVRLQNKTKELFFKCLDEGRDLDYFKAKLEELWGTVDYTYTQDEINEYEALIHERNIEGREIVEETPKGEYGSLFALVPLSVVIGVDKKFQKVKEREYKNSLNSYAYKTDKQEYLKLKVAKYTNQTVPYEVHKYEWQLINNEYKRVKTEEVIGYRYVQPSTYNSMIHNTNLTRSGWNTTLNDADIVGVRRFYIPYHPFSCEYCISHQERPMSKYDVINMIGNDETVEGDILHPNCKCTLTFYDNNVNLKEINEDEAIEQYHIRQQVNTLTLRKEEVLSDIKIQKSLGNQDVVDELNNMRNSINKKIRELQSKLPTEELKKQVVAINREKRISSNKYVEQARKNIIKKEQNKTKEKLLKETKRNKEKLNQMKKLSSQTHKEMQELFKIRENRPKYMEQLEKKQQELKEIRKIIKQENKDMKYWKSKQQELSLKVDIKNLKDLINK